METYAIILARGGSQSIPKKNMAAINGKPLLQWSIEVALGSKYVNEVIVSSDDSDILELATNCGAVPLLRPLELSTGNATSESGWLHAIANSSNKVLPEYFFALQATSPLRTSKDLDHAFENLRNNNYDCLFSAEEIRDHYIWKNRDGNIKPDNFNYEDRGMRQTLERKFLENGSFYILNTEMFLNFGTRHFGNIGVYSMPKFKSIQIDEPDDLIIAKALMREFDEFK